MAGTGSVRRDSQLIDLALPHRDEHLPDRLGGPRPPTAAVGTGRRVEPLGPLVRGENVAWLQPLPDSLLDAGDPARAVIDRSSLRLAFAAALQHLSARQRAALILCDVLSFSAAEAAEILGTTRIGEQLAAAGARPAEGSGVRQERSASRPQPSSEPGSIAT